MTEWGNRLPVPLTLCLSPKAGKLAMERGWAINVGEFPGRPGLLGPGGWEGQEESEGRPCELRGSGALLSGIGGGYVAIWCLGGTS